MDQSNIATNEHRLEKLICHCSNYMCGDSKKDGTHDLFLIRGDTDEIPGVLTTRDGCFRNWAIRGRVDAVSGEAYCSHLTLYLRCKRNIRRDWVGVDYNSPKYQEVLLLEGENDVDWKIRVEEDGDFRIFFTLNKKEGVDYKINIVEDR